MEEIQITSKYALLSVADYIKLNHSLSVAKGYDLANDTARCFQIVPELAKVDILDESFKLACVALVDAEAQEKFPELLTGIELVESYIPAEINEIPVINGEIEPEAIDWALNHCQEQGVDNSNLVTYIASRDVANYQPIPNIGVWCEAKVYSYNGNKVKCLQPHTRMHYTPEETPALWLIIPTVQVGYPEWKQPTGAHDAYQLGDKVLFNGKNYESKINANVWSPAVYPAGWKLI